MKLTRTIAIVTVVGMALAVAPVSAGPWLYSEDIGGDLDMSDPPGYDPEEVMDCGDIYRVVGGQPLLWKNDNNANPWGGYPIATGSAAQPTPVIIGTSSSSEAEILNQYYSCYFDLDAEDQLKVTSFSRGGQYPADECREMGVVPLGGLTASVHLSFDDDGPRGWAYTGDVPTNSGPDNATEIWRAVVTPFPSVIVPAAPFPVADEQSLGLGPNPGPQARDDDVDALDYHGLFRDPTSPGAYQARFFSADHEAHQTWTLIGVLDPGDIYMTTRQPGVENIVKALDDVTHFGVHDDTDIDAFEFVAIDGEWTEALFGYNLLPGMYQLAALFSVDQWDLDTPNTDESGNLNPNVIYISDLLGNYAQLSGEYEGDIDALAVVPEPATMSLLCIGGLALLRKRRR